MKLNLSTVALALVFVGVLLFRYPWAHAWTTSQIVGWAIATPAFALFVVARIQLGSAFSVRAKATTLVTHGVYARLRHPIYVFGALIIIGALLIAQRPWWLLIFVGLVPLQFLRVRKEEQTLEATFGEDYRRYREKTWF